MSAQASPAVGQVYGVERVCRVWGVPRATFYAQRARAAAAVPVPRRRGPPPRVSDVALLAAIRADLAATPYVGEGYRKVWARLRVERGVRVGAKRVLRLMRDHRLLSPHRGRQGAPVAHDGRITTDVPGVMWGTDGTRVFTVDDGWVWIFVAVEHWNAECVGWHVCKRGDRFAALQPIAMGLRAYHGGVGANAGRGLALRMDHGTQYLADHFRDQLRYWGVAASFAFVAEPQTNGVAERFNRTLKEQAIHGRVFRTVAEVRAAVAAFIEKYNATWRVEKLRFQTPLEARSHYELGAAA